MTLEIGVASYKSADSLKRTLDSIHAMTVQPFKLRIWHNRSEGDDACLDVIDSLKCERTISENVGYAGAVNGMLARSRADLFLYCDNDIEVRTSGWDVRMAETLAMDVTIAQVFPGSGHYGFYNGRYHECLWNAGYCWMLRTSAKPWVAYGWPLDEPPPDHPDHMFIMSQGLGHHEEVDLMIRLRLAGYLIACCPDVDVRHMETATQSPESAKRIHAGVVRWMNKWNRYFCGDVFTYPNPDPDSGEGYDPRMLRYTDWPPCALYLERFTLAMFPEWNKWPHECRSDFTEAVYGYRTVQVPGVGQMDAVEILKPEGFYRGRAI